MTKLIKLKRGKYDSLIEQKLLNQNSCKPKTYLQFLSLNNNQLLKDRG